MKRVLLVTVLVLTGCNFDDAQCHALKLANGSCDLSGPDGGPENSTAGDGGFLVASADHFAGPLPGRHVIVVSQESSLSCPTPTTHYPASSVAFTFKVTPMIETPYDCAAALAELTCEVDGSPTNQGTVTIHVEDPTLNVWKGHFSNLKNARGSFDGDFNAPTTNCGP